jgi:hypothetical protein
LDTDPVVAKACKRLESARIAGVGFAHRTRDLKVAFENGLLLRAFVKSIEQEQWELRRFDGLRIGVGEKLVIRECKADPDASDTGTSRE